MSEIEVVAIGLLYGIAAFSLALAVGNVNVRAARRNQGIDAYRVKLFGVTVIGAAIGGFSQTRGLTVLQTAATALIVAALAAALTADETSTGGLLPYVSGLPVVFVIVAAVLDGMWPSMWSALFAAIPFLITALLVRDRIPTLVNAAVAALAGATIGIESAIFVMCAASICALAFTKIGRRSIAKLRLAPYIAAFTLLGMLLDMSLLAA